MADIPHFNFPFRFSGAHVAVVEQDSMDDVANCVEIIFMTPIGWRPEAPTFGVPDFAFMKQPIGEDFLTDIISSQEPRADVAFTEAPDRYDELIDHIVSQIGTRGVQTS